MTLPAWIRGEIAALLLMLALVPFGCSPDNNRPARLTVFISGNTKGFLENCGCSGGQSGGMHRRARMIETEREHVQKPLPNEKGASDILVLDTGDFSDPEDPRQRLRSKGVVRAMEMIGYDAVGLGTWELGFAPAELYGLLTEGRLPYIAANLSFKAVAGEEDYSGKLTELIKPYRVVTTESGYKVGIIHIIDNAAQLRGVELHEAYQLSDPVRAAEDIIAKHKDEAEMWFVSVVTVPLHGVDNKSVADIPGIHLVFGMRGQNPNQSSEGVVFPYFIERPYDKGKDVTVATISFGEENKVIITGEKKAIRDDVYGPDEKVLAMINDMKPELEALELQIAEEKLNEHKLMTGVPIYVGHTTCANCHSDIAVQMAGTKHMHAYETLAAIDMEHASCAQCHNAGFNQPGGWNVVKDKLIEASATWEMRNVSCENCHGPGEYHVKLHQNGIRVPGLSEDGRDAQGLQPAKASCITCHDSENSPAFKFETYWPHVQHGSGLTPKPGSPPGAGMGGANQQMGRQLQEQHDHGHEESGSHTRVIHDWLLAQL